MKKQIGVLVIGILYLSFTATVPTVHAGAGGSDSDKMVKQKNHCAVLVEPIREGEETSKASSIDCFPTFSEAVSVATHGEVSLSMNATPELSEDVIAQASTVLGIQYEHSNYGGSSFIWYTSNPYGCYNSATGQRYRYTVSSMSSYAGSWWNDRISSARTYANCRSYYFEHSYYGGAALRVNSSRSGFGAMNDRASSIKFVPYFELAY